MANRQYQAWVVCFSAALFFFFEFIQLNMFNALGPDLLKEFKIDAPVLATISDKYFLANILFLFPAGMILDQVSTRKLIFWSMLTSVLCTFAFAGATAVWQMKLARFVTGIAGSFCLLSAVRLASRWFLPRQMALVVGLIVTFAMVGGMVAQTPLMALINLLGWRWAVGLDAGFGLVLLLLIYLFVQDHPKKPLAGSEHVVHAALKGREFWLALIQTMKEKQNWLCGLYTSLMNLPIFLLGAIWGIFYLTQVRHLTDHQASLATFSLFLGVIIGSPTAGWFSDSIGRRKSPMIIGAVVSLVLILLLMELSTVSTLTAMWLFFLIGFATSTQIISYPLIAESNPLSVTATAEGLASTLIMAGGFTQDLFALLIQKNWDHQLVNGVPQYSPNDFHLGMMIMPIAFVISLLITIFLRESHCKPFAPKILSPKE